MDIRATLRNLGERLDAAVGAPAVESNRVMSGREGETIVMDAMRRGEILERIQPDAIGAPAVYMTTAQTGLSPETTAQTYGQ